MACEIDPKVFILQKPVVGTIILCEFYVWTLCMGQICTRDGSKRSLTLIWIIILFDEAFKYGDGATVWGYVETNDDPLCVEICNFVECRNFVIYNFLPVGLCFPQFFNQVVQMYYSIVKYCKGIMRISCFKNLLL